MQDVSSLAHSFYIANFNNYSHVLKYVHTCFFSQRSSILTASKLNNSKAFKHSLLSRAFMVHVNRENVCAHSICKHLEENNVIIKAWALALGIVSRKQFLHASEVRATGMKFGRTSLASRRERAAFFWVLIANIWDGTRTLGKNQHRLFTIWIKSYSS